MHLILTEDVPHLGSLGDEVQVKNGYARNYLLPRGKAILSGTKKSNLIEHKRKRLDQLRAVAIEQARSESEKVGALEIKVKAKAGVNGRLFGSVTNRDIQAKLEEEGYTLDRRSIIIPSLIKSLGTFTVTVKLHTDVKVDIKVLVEPLIDTKKEAGEIAEGETIEGEAPEDATPEDVTMDGAEGEANQTETGEASEDATPEDVTMDGAEGEANQTETGETPENATPVDGGTVDGGTADGVTDGGTVDGGTADGVTDGGTADDAEGEANQTAAGETPEGDPVEKDATMAENKQQESTGETSAAESTQDDPSEKDAAGGNPDVAGAEETASGDDADAGEEK